MTDGGWVRSGGSIAPAPAPAQAIDLGLPSGTKWASCNVGAKKPEEYGGYYAWGEIEEKEEYNSENYIYHQYPQVAYMEWLFSNGISGTPYDVAFMKWGAPWKMPTQEQIKELLNCCSHKWTTLNGVNGVKFTGPNGNTIFLPMASYRSSDNLDITDGVGYYWSSTPFQSSPSTAYELEFASGRLVRDHLVSFCGLSVRPVSK